MGFIGADGKYYSGTPRPAEIMPERSAVWKQTDHDRQRQDHKMDLIKPYHYDGSVNQDFIDAYPEESKEVYKLIPTDEQILREH